MALATTPLALSASASGQTNIIINFTNKNGAVHDAQIVRVQGDKVIYRLESGGGGVVPLSDLPEYWRTRFGNTNTSVIADPTNAPTLITFEPEKLWTPTPQQKKLEGSYFFETKVDEFDRKISHKLFNFSDLNEFSFTTFIKREYAPGGASEYYCLVVARLDPSESHYSFDPQKPLQMIVDGQRFTVADKASITEGEADWKDLKWNERYGCHIPEALVRALGKCKKAAVRVPCRAGNYTHDYTALELQRFGIFCAVYMPSEGEQFNAVPANIDQIVK
jgi:hypothetical protein